MPSHPAALSLFLLLLPLPIHPRQMSNREHDAQHTAGSKRSDMSNGIPLSLRLLGTTGERQSVLAEVQLHHRVCFVHEPEAMYAFVDLHCYCYYYYYLITPLHSFDDPIG